MKNAFLAKQHDARLPMGAINSGLSQGGISLPDIDEIIFYDKPLVSFERLLEICPGYASRRLPFGFYCCSTP